MTKKERFVLVSTANSGSSCPTLDGKLFVPENSFQATWAKSTESPSSFYLPISFPESQLFMDSHMKEIFLINDKDGIGKHGCAAYFVEEGLYKKVVAKFEKEIETAHTFNEPNNRYFGAGP